MRGGGRAERHIERALEALGAALGETGAPWMVIGGIAVIARGVRRLTTDIDAVVRGDAVALDRLLRVLARRRITPRIDDAEEFARENMVLLLRHDATGVDLDVSLAWSAFEHEALASRVETDFGRVRAPMATAEDLVVFKAVAARPRDVEDAAALVLLHPGIDVARVRRRVRELAAAADAPELEDALERALALARAAGGHGPKAKGPGAGRRRRPAR